MKWLLHFSANISLSLIHLPYTVRDSIIFSVGLDLIMVFMTFQVCFMSLLYFVNSFSFNLDRFKCISVGKKCFLIDSVRFLTKFEINFILLSAGSKKGFSQPWSVNG